MPKRGNTLIGDQIDELHKQLYPDDQPPAEEVQAAPPEQNSESDNQPEAQAGEAEAAPSEEAPQTDAPADPAPESGDVDWEQRFRSLQGKYDNEVPHLTSQLRQTQEMLSQLGTATEFPDLSTVKGLTQEDIDTYGDEMIDVIRRAADERVAPYIQQMQEQNQQMAARLQQSAESFKETSREAMLASLTAAVPDWQQQNNDQGFLDWLNQYDVLSGQRRHDLLSQAFDANDTNRVIAFFKGYKLEQTGAPQAAVAASEAQPPKTDNGLETLVAPGQPAGTAATGAQQSGRIWSREEITRLTNQKIQGKMSPEQAQQLDTELHRAAMEGRIR